MRLLVAALVVGIALAACGSDSSPLAEDSASAPAQPEAQQETAAEAPSQEEPSPSEPSQQAQQAEEAEQAQPDQAETPDTDDSAEPLPSEIVGSHKGIRSERNLLGEPDAPVEIRYFGDFT